VTTAVPTNQKNTFLGAEPVGEATSSCGDSLGERSEPNRETVSDANRDLPAQHLNDEQPPAVRAVGEPNVAR
jgi:hypothetical protein